MTTAPLPPLPAHFASSSEHLQNDVRNYATQARADLEAENKRLREALDWCIAEINRDSPSVLNARATLEKTK